MIALVSLVAVLLYNIFEQKPFKFENFKTAEEAKAYLDEHYLGKNINKIWDDISFVGAKCMERPEKIPKHEMGIKLDGEYEKVYECQYSNNFISLHPLTSYYFSLFVDNNSILVGVFIKKESKIGFP